MFEDDKDMEMKKVNCHNVKIDSDDFFAVIDGERTFEIRLNDSDYKKGDFIIFHEAMKNAVTGRTIEKRIGFVTNYKQSDDYVVFSLLDIK